MSIKREGIGSKISNNLWMVGTGVGLLAATMAVVAPDALGGMISSGLGLDAEVSGQFESTNPELGEWTFAPNACRSGEPMGFHGVLLGAVDDDQHFVRVARDPATGKTVVSAAKPGTDKVAVFDGCEVDSQMHRTNTSVNEVWGMQGSVTIECKDDGFTGTATFANCY